MKQITLIFIFVLMSSAVFAQDARDVVFLKNGSVIKGQIMEMIPDKHVKIETNDGNIFVYSFAEIEKIEKEAIEGLSQSKKETGETARVFTSANSHAKTKQGNIVLSGSAGFISSFYNIKVVYDGETYNEYNMNSVSLQPSFGYFIIDDLAIGLSSTITLNSSKYEDGDKYEETTFLIVPTALYYFPIEGNIRPLIQAGIGFGGSSSKDIPKSGDDEKGSTFGPVFNFGGGAAFFVRENISLNLGISYTSSNFTNSDDNKLQMKQGNFAGNIGISVYL